MKLTTLLMTFCLVVSANLSLADSTSSDWPRAVQDTPQFSWARGLSLTTHYLWLNETEYLPAIDEEIYHWKERSLQLQLTKAIQNGRFGLGYIDGLIEQENELFNDTDFALTRRAPFAVFDWQWSPRLSSRARLRYEEFSNDGDSGFYQLADEESLWTGYAVISYQHHQWWCNLSYARERDPEPIFDAANERAELKITAQQLTGANLGWVWNPQWETAAGIYYEGYGSDRPDQFNYTLQLTHQPSWLTRLRASLGVGYYTEEQDTLVNLTVNYRHPLSDKLTLMAEYQLEFSDDEQSLLNQGQLLLRYAVSRRVAVTISGEYSAESGDDHDDSLFAVAQLEYRFN